MTTQELVDQIESQGFRATLSEMDANGMLLLSISDDRRVLHKIPFFYRYLDNPNLGMLFVADTFRKLRESKSVN